jgi:transposase
VQQHQFISAHIYAIAYPSTGQTGALISPALSTGMLQKYLQQISYATPLARDALVITDCASWHTIKLNNKFTNLSKLHLPRYSFGLNPIEQVWVWLRSNDLTNFAYKNYEHIVDQVSNAWNNFRHQVDHVKPLCKRDGTHLLTN